MKNPMKLVLKSEKIRVPSRRPATSERHRGQLRATWFQLVNLWKKTASSHQHSPTIWSGWCYQLRSFWGLRTETKKKEILRWSKPLELEGALLFLSGFEAHSRCFGACIQPPKHRLWKMWPQGVCTMTSVMRRNVGRSSERMGMERMVLTR